METYEILGDLAKKYFESVWFGRKWERMEMNRV